MTRIAVFAFLTAMVLLTSGAILGVENVPADAPAPADERLTAMQITLAEG